MATWDADAETTHPIDFRLVHNTFVTMFWRSSLLDETVGWLRSHDYRVAEFDAGSWSSDADMYDDVALALNFPDYFGRNLDALNDCMRDVASGDYGRDADANTGLVMCSGPSTPSQRWTAGPLRTCSTSSRTRPGAPS